MKIEIPAFNQVKALVVGDVMLDQYWQGNTSRISPEAPVPVVHVQQLSERPGGAGNVALNLAALGCQVELIGLVGDDLPGKTLAQHLEKVNVACHFVALKDAPTITKLRVIGRQQQLVRLDFEKQFQAQDAEKLVEVYESRLQDKNVIILSDYGKGSLAQVQKLIELARKRGIPVLVDPKSYDFSVYQGATMVTPNLKEFEAVVGPCKNEQELMEKGLALMNRHQLEALLVTRSENGMSLFQRNAKPFHLPTRAREVYDVTGAGDTVIGVLAASLAAGHSFESAAMLANTAAGLVVQKLGAAALSLSELRRAWQRHHDSGLGILSEEDLLIAVADARAHHETIVMTNGCFDLLHPGHVAYLEQAKELGTRLIVAVNDDASVKRLKGNNRPLNSVQDRMKVLSGLRAVDWVVSFSEDTPLRLIKRISPDVLVKGGDYRVEDIAGSADVLAAGGKVEILTFVDGYSTTRLIERMPAKTTVE
jgi:D-beta-D-heptose 7-phosphate kinase/D-beta-D-heptose 1-phosphate adenosyltransferase